MFSSTTDSLFGDPSESRSLFGGRPGSESNELRVTKSPHRYGALSPSDTKWLTSPERCIQHSIRPTDTLQGISVKYSVPIELLKNVNNLWGHDQLFLRDKLLVPIPNNPTKKHNGHVTSSDNMTSSENATSSENHVTSSPNHVTSSLSYVSHPVPDNSRVQIAASADKTPTAATPPISSLSPDEDKQLDNLFSRFDTVLRTTRASTLQLRSNSNLDFSPQLANVSSLTRSASTVSIVEPGPHGSRTHGRTRYKRGRRDFYTDDELPPSSSDEIYLL